MNKIYKFAALLSACLMAFAGCAPEELSTDQLSDENVTFAAMAPNPVARGGALRIQGSNLDKVVEVRIPGVEPITEIIQVDSLKGRLSEIRVVVPVDGPEIGKVVIVDRDGNEYASHADLTYSEPIVYTGFTAAETVYPGDVVTIKGDYMNNIRAVQFGTSAAVTEFVEQSRYELKVAVPADAVTGKVILCDVDENNNPEGKVSNLFYSEKDLTVGKPTVENKARGVVKAGQTIVIGGEHLEMIASASLPFTLTEAGKIEIVLPADVQDGEITLTSYAGDQFNAGAYQTLVPSELKHSAAKGYKAGNEIVISGKDLDLVTELTIGEVVTSFTYADNKLTATILGASKDGKVTVKLANGKTVDAADQVTLVKPAITGISNLEFYVPDVTEVEVTGTDLDLVTGATLGGREIEFKYADDKITLLPTVTSVSGKVAFTLENGVVVESAEAVTVLYHSIVVVTEMTAAQHIGMEVVIKGSNMDQIENIFIGDEKVTQYSLRAADEVRFLMPWLKVGMYDVSFLLFNGDTETQAQQIEVQLELDVKTIWEGEQHITWTGMDQLSWGKFDFSTVKPGTIMTAYFTLDENPEYDPQVRFGDGNWNSLPSGVAIAGGDGNIIVGADATYYSITLTADDLAILKEKGLVMTGTFYTLTKLTLTSEISQETTLWEGELIADNWTAQPYVLSDAGVELAAVGAQPGQTIYFYLEQIGADPWKVEIVEGHWTGVTYGAYCAVGADTESGKFKEWDLSANGGRVSITVTQEMLDAAYTQQWWGGTFILNADNTKCTKVTIL